MKKFKLEINTIEQITMLLQFLLAILLIIMGIATLFNKNLIMIVKVIIGLMMFVISYNNYKVYKRKYMTMIYFGLGLIILATTFFA